MTANRDLSGRVALITGGTHGIGLGIAELFLGAGSKVFVVGRSERNLISALRHLGSMGEIEGTTADVAVVADTQRIADETVAAFDRIDVLVNVAGVFVASEALDTTEEQFDHLFDTNVKGTYFCTQSVASRMIDDGTRGSVINIGSIAGQRAFVGVSAYGMTKAAVEQLTRAFAAELAPFGINVNCIVPGTIDMPTNVLMQEPGAREAAAAATPARRNGSPDDVGWAALYLASPAAEFVHGASIAVDGGRLAVF